MKMLFFLMISAQLAQAAEFDKKVTVNGQCFTETSPDRGTISFVASSVDADAKSAITKATALYEKLRDQLKRSNTKNLELSTSEYTVQEKKEWENNKNVSKGFEARLGLRVITTDISSLGEIISIAAKAGVKDSHSMNTYLSETKLNDEKKKCLDIAAKNAREKAETLVKSLGAKLGRVLQITEGGAIPPPQPMPMMERGMMKSSDAMAPSIEGQKQNINQTVDVTFAIE